MLQWKLHYILVCILLFWMKMTFCFEYYSIIACGLTDLNTLTFESLKKIFVALQDLYFNTPVLGGFNLLSTSCPGPSTNNASLWCLQSTPVRLPTIQHLELRWPGWLRTSNNNLQDSTQLAKRNGNWGIKNVLHVYWGSLFINKKWSIVINNVKHFLLKQCYVCHMYKKLL